VGKASLAASTVKLHWKGYGGVWEENAFSLGAAVGIRQGLDVKGDVFLSKPSHYSDSMPDRFMGGSGRVKWAPAPLSGHVALTAGAGVSRVHEWMAFNLDQGTMVGFDNRYLIPYANWRWFYTKAFPGEGQFYPTWGHLMLVGLEVPWDRDRSSSYPSSIKAEVGRGNLYGEGVHFSYVLFGAHAQVSFSLEL
jgi:hypothetical protein